MGLRAYVLVTTITYTGQRSSAHLSPSCTTWTLKVVLYWEDVLRDRTAGDGWVMECQGHVWWAGGRQAGASFGMLWFLCVIPLPIMDSSGRASGNLEMQVPRGSGACNHYPVLMSLAGDKAKVLLFSFLACDPSPPFGVFSRALAM